jgi:beta-lactamase regulating signal transducer with metallopeptidase domain
MSADLLLLLIRIVLAFSIAIAIVLALRIPMREIFGARVAYGLWLLVPVAAIAALLPARLVLIETPASIEAAAPVAPVDTRIADVVASPEAADFVITRLDASPYIIALWALGFAISLALLALGQRRFTARLGFKRRADGVHVAQSENVGPAVVGVVVPRIVVPADFDARYTEVERQLVLEHERAHIRAGDVQVNALAAFLQCVFWFNPLAYIARAALRIDQELACDERVMQRHAGSRRAYAEAMLKTQLAARAVPLGCAWPPVGAQPLKQRISALARPSVGNGRRAIGAGVCLATACAVGLGAWVAQPPRHAYAHEVDNGILARFAGPQLVQALMDGDTETARALIEAGANVNHWSPGDGTPLIMAARLEDADLVSELIAAGADVNQVAHGDGTPLIVAARQDDTRIAALLLRAGADVNQPAPGDGNPLIAASSSGNMSLVRMFVEAGAEVNAIVRNDETPLINAARHGRLDVARYLIEHGADVNLAVEARTLRGTELRSPLSMATRGGHADMVALLRAAGART